jgi:acetyl-CoA C-acetyltransferase
VKPHRDALEADALVCAFDGTHVGAATEKYQRPLNISRAELDGYAAQSHARAAAAIDARRLQQECVEVRPRAHVSADEETRIHVASSAGPLLVDEGVRRDATIEKLSWLKPAFSTDGTITAGSASQLSDGACAMVLMSRDEAERRGLEWLAEIVNTGAVSGPDASLLGQPSAALLDALERDGSTLLGDIDLFEINEAFASIVIETIRQLKLEDDQVNVNGGAIALGHPVGMSGARLVLTTATELARRGGGTGAAALCGGGGQGEAFVLKVPIQ